MLGLGGGGLHGASTVSASDRLSSLSLRHIDGDVSDMKGASKQFAFEGPQRIERSPGANWVVRTHGIGLKCALPNPGIFARSGSSGDSSTEDTGEGPLPGDPWVA